MEGIERKKRKKNPAYYSGGPILIKLVNCT